MPLPRRTGRIGVERAASPSASQRLPGGRGVRAGATSQRIPRGDRPTGSTSKRLASTGRDTRSTRTRLVPGPEDQKKTTLAMIGGAVGAVVVLLLAVVLFTGSRSAPPTKKKAPPQQTLDASGHARESAVRGDEGIRKGKEAVDRYERVRASMSEAQRSEIVDLLNEANNDLDSALMHLEQAMNMAAPGFDPGIRERRFIEMRKVVRDLLKELQK